jgi:hypothetical protein
MAIMAGFHTCRGVDKFFKALAKLEKTTGQK